MNNVVYRSAHTGDCFRLAHLHKQYMPNSFLGMLGIPLLHLIYNALVQYEGGILIVAEHDGEYVGFVSGVDRTKLFYRFFIKKNFIKAPLTLLPQVFNRATVVKILEVLGYGNKESDDNFPQAELLSIVVITKAQGKGVSQALFNHLVDRFKSMHIECFKIAVGQDLRRAHAFYVKMNCRKKAEITLHSGTRSYIYVYGD